MSENETETKDEAEAEAEPGTEVEKTWPSKGAAKKYPFHMTPRAKMAAFYDAQGLSPTEIARLCELAHRTTISQWRQQPLYLEERQRWIDKTTTDMEPVMMKLKIGYIDLLETARQRLAQALVARDPEGREIWSTQLAAIKLLGESPVVRALFGESNDRVGAAKAGAAAQSVVHLHIKKDGDDVIDIKTAEEVVEDGEHRPGD